MASESREVERRIPAGAVDPVDEPSAEWGWHGGFPKGTVAGGVVTIILCLAFMIGPYQTSTQDLWLVGVVVVIIAGTIAQVIHKRNSWRR